jgi:hypothetical protein
LLPRESSKYCNVLEMIIQGRVREYLWIRTAISECNFFFFFFLYKHLFFKKTFTLFKKTFTFSKRRLPFTACKRTAIYCSTARYNVSSCHIKSCGSKNLLVYSVKNFPLTRKYFARLLLNRDHLNKSVLLHCSQFKRIEQNILTVKFVL